MKKRINLSNTGTAGLFSLLLLLGMGIASPSYAQEGETFSCGKFQQYTATKMQLPNNEEVALIVWQNSEDQTAEERCEAATQALEDAYSQGEQILSINPSNNAVCSTNQVGGACKNDLFIPGSDAEQALNVIFAIEEEPTNNARMLLQGERYARAGNKPYFDLKELRNQWLQLREQKQKP